MKLGSSRCSSASTRSKRFALACCFTFRAAAYLTVAEMVVLPAGGLPRSPAAGAEWTLSSSMSASPPWSPPPGPCAAVLSGSPSRALLPLSLLLLPLTPRRFRGGLLLGDRFRSPSASVERDARPLAAVSSGALTTDPATRSLAKAYSRASSCMRGPSRRKQPSSARRAACASPPDRFRAAIASSRDISVACPSACTTPSGKLAAPSGARARAARSGFNSTPASSHAAPHRWDPRDRASILWKARAASSKYRTTYDRSESYPPTDSLRVCARVSARRVRSEGAHKSRTASGAPLAPRDHRKADMAVWNSPYASGYASRASCESSSRARARASAVSPARSASTSSCFFS
mmetsp:Transcript_4938/g.14220  ORF Transcript_4938/g.14220 Transcript_4938/m.14220 type:complete len:348 (+) Transcript_4938:1234-2277(+)